MRDLVKSSDTYEPDNLINDISVPLITKSVKVKKGAELKRGTVLGLATTTGYGAIVDSAKTDGTEKADCILAEDINADEDMHVVAYASGQFNRRGLIVSASDDIEKHETRLRELGIFVKDNI